MSITGPILLLLCCAGACSTAEDSEQQAKAEGERRRQTMAKSYAKVDASNGIDEVEARELSRSYFNVYISGCGGIFTVEPEGDAWRVGTLVGLGAKPGPDIIVDKRIGRISCVTGPTISFALSSPGLTGDVVETPQKVEPANVR